MATKTAKTTSNLSGLVPAHRGYEFQDLLVACRFVDILLGNVVEAHCDEKLFPDDRFDDLTTTSFDGKRERCQFKHTDNDDRPLTLGTFTNDKRDLRLDKLFRSMLADRDGPGSHAKDVVFRVVLRDRAATDPKLVEVLQPKKLDPGSYLQVIQTARFGFDAAKLQQQDGRNQDEESSFRFLFTGNTPLSQNDLRWCCDRLVIEVDAPRASFDLTDPGIAEKILLTRARSEIGAESFPNESRQAIDVAAALISAARAARQQLLKPTPKELLRRTKLRSDFGAVSRSHPVDSSLEVRRPRAVQQFLIAAEKRAAEGGFLLVQGPPGHGKSWICQQILEEMSDKGWLIAEHYCYLGDADGERLERVLVEAVFGSLVARLADADLRLVQDQRPRFAADEDALVNCLQFSRDLEPDRRIALVIDGVDHITRVRRSSGNSSFDPSRSMSEALASLDLPLGTVVIVLSQPGAHLNPLNDAGAELLTLEGLSRNELSLLASRLELIPDSEADVEGKGSPRIEDSEAGSKFLAALAERSGGNALYATYLCQEVLRSIDVSPDPAKMVLQLPSFDGTLTSYYEYLYRSLGSEAMWVADVIALVDFPVSRAELCEIRPDAAHRVNTAIEHLKPVLLEQATQGGIRVYHESFARYLRTPFQDNPTALAALIEKVTSWLEKKGLFADSRAFRSLLQLLAEVGENGRVLDLVDGDFVVKAAAGSFPTSEIKRNLGIAVRAAARLEQWPVVVRYVELSRSADSFHVERFDSTLVDFADVPATLIGADTLAARLLNGDRLVMPAREGLQLCATLDKLGAVAPWQLYLDGYLRELDSDNTSYGEESDLKLALVRLRGWLRLASKIQSAEPPGSGDQGPPQTDKTVNLNGLAQWIEDRGLPMKEVVRAVLDTHGWEDVVRLAEAFQEPSSAYLAMAHELEARPGLDPHGSSPRQWAEAAVAHGLPLGARRRALAFGVDLAVFTKTDIATSRERLIGLTREVEERLVRPEQVNAWLDACTLAARRDPVGLNAAEAVVSGGDGWYRCWLRFAIALSRVDTATLHSQGFHALEAIRLLTDDLRPFAGDPRACDLYSLEPVIEESLRHALNMLDDEQWSEGLLILKKVSKSITTTLSGEGGGPVPPRLVLHLAVAGANPDRRDVAEQLISDELAEGSGRRFYSDLAEYRLLAARLALAADDRQEAERLWQESCALLAGYGRHKDITIFELLDPLPNLIVKDRAKACLRVARVQALCERVLRHTNRKETGHAIPRWWSLLAKADPKALAHLVVPTLLRECNDPNSVLNEALEDVWREWFRDADPMVAGVLRLTLDTPLDPSDPKQLERLAEADGPEGRQLLTLLLARIDERSVSYPYSNSDKLLEKDNQHVKNLNSIAEKLDLPSISAVRSKTASKESDDGESYSRARAGTTKLEVNPVVNFPIGSAGLAQAIRAWRSRPYDVASPEWETERFANAIGYRLVELLAENRFDDARSALWSLADASAGLGERVNILRSIAEGLQRHGEVKLAAIAFSLTWTRTRGHEGWLAFGGETEIEALNQAMDLDAGTAGALVAEEIELRVSSSRFGTYGISQAIIHALVVGALSTDDETHSDLAFSAWDEAFDVINSRAPRVADSDDPAIPYEPPLAGVATPMPNTLEEAFALAAIAGIAHAGREKKRRAFLATHLLLKERPAVCERVLPAVLDQISDPATLSWLLSLLESSGSSAASVIEACQDVLRELSSRDHLTVRALARRMITGEPPPLVAPTSPDKALLREPSQVLWTPEPANGDDDNSPAPELLLKSVAVRAQRAESMLEGLYEAVCTRAVNARKNDYLQKRLQQQLRNLGDQALMRCPDAFLTHEQTLEEILQTVAAGGRAAKLVAGELVTDPAQWEDYLASALLDDPIVPLLLEARRVPRPFLQPPPGLGDELWKRIQEWISGDTSHNIEAASSTEGRLFATLTLAPISELPTVTSGPYRNWYWLGTFERRRSKPRDWRSKNILDSTRFQILEVRNLNDRQALTLPPVTRGDIRWWRAEINQAAGGRPFGSSQPLLGIDTELEMVGDGRLGLGVPDSLLSPTAPLLAPLGLSPGDPFVYEDDSGPALALVTWRAEYDVSDRYLAWPRTFGCGVVMRPDLLAALVEIAGEERLVRRDFVEGDVGLIGSTEA